MFNYLRIIEIEFMIKEMIRETMIVVLFCFFINISLLFFTFINIKVLLEGDYIIAILYITSGLIGKYLGLIEYKMSWFKKFFRFKK